jgi:antitoxin component YwqK of YwqJK toxin-antitoxin module
MKITIVLFLILLSVHSYSQEVVKGPFLIRDGITYHQDTNEPVIGIIQSFFPNSSQIAERQTYRDGRRDGPSESFHENGQLDITGNLTDGKRNGLFKTFDENGQLETRGNYKDGELHGLFEYFDEEGNLTETVTYQNGVEVK